MDDPHRVSPSSGLPRARAVIAADANGPLHLIAPYTSILDLVGLNRCLARDLRVTPARATDAVSAIPGFYAHASVVDESLFEHEAVALDTDRPDEVVTVDADEIRSMVPPAQRMGFALPADAEADRPAREQDRTAIHDCLTRFTPLRIRARLDETLTIPPLPEAARRIIALKADPDWDLGDVTRVIEADPSLAALTLGWANSAYYGVRQRVTSLPDAISRVLGPEATLNMALAIATRETLRVPPAVVRGLSPYWLTALFSAATMEALARIYPIAERPNTGLAYLTGLLCNFGTLVIGHVFPPHYAAICRQHEANLHLPHTGIDVHMLGIPREAFAAELLACWSVPEEVCHAVRYQHVSGRDGAYDAFVGLLQLTHQLLNARGIATTAHRRAEEDLGVRLKLDREAVDGVVQLIATSADELDGFARAIAC